ncbi:MAG: hemin receptor [Hyphomicrobiales bacterium]|nr:MAG: hemin receptor [Hyphomicrobiales bacterium]
MTPEQIDLVQASFRQVAPISETAAELFYGRLFEIAPEVQVHFKGDMKNQGRMLMQTLATVVNSLKDLEAILPAVKELAARHVDYGIKAEHYAPVGASLIWTLQKGLGDDFTEETRQAWVAAYDALSHVMIETAYGGKTA